MALVRNDNSTKCQQYKMTKYKMTLDLDEMTSLQNDITTR